MPQDRQRRPSVVEAYERRQQQQRRPSVVEAYEQRQAEPSGFLDNVSIGAERGYYKTLLPAAQSIAEVTEGIKRGDFGPLWQMVKESGRGIVSSLAGGTEPALIKSQRLEAEARARASGFPVASDTLASVDVNPLRAVAESQAAPIVEAQARRDARYQATPQARRAQQRLAELDQRAALDSSILGQATRGASEAITAAAPTIATAVATRGAVIPTALAAAAQSANQPAMAGANAAAGLLPIPAGKFVAPVLRRLRAGRNAGTVAAEAGNVAEGQAAFRAGANAARLETLPVRESISRPPVLEAAESRPFGVREGAPRAAKPGATGPAIDQYGFIEGGSDWEAIGRAGAELATKSERTGLLEVVSAARKAGLLTSVKTHIKNVAGTGAFQLSEELSRMPGAVVDMLVSGVTKRRTLTGPSLGSMQRSAHEAATAGWEEAKKIWRNGVTQSDVERLGLNAEINSGSKIFDAYINRTFRALAVEDKLLHTYAARRALEDRAKALALTEMRQGKIARGQVGERTREILKAPPEDLAAAAIADGEVAVFTNENLVSKFLAGGRKEIEKIPGGRVATFGVDLVFPFTKTPTNVIARMLDYAGLGAAKESTKAIARRIVGRSMTEAQQRAFAQAWGRASVGAGLVTLGYVGYKNGWLTGFIEDDPARRERDEASGRIPGAILIGGRWHQLLGAAPLASLLIIGATLAREVDQEREESSGLLPVLETFGQAIGEQPLLIGSKTVAESLTKPGTTGEKFLGGAIGSFVPTFASDIAEAIDPAQREAKGIFGQAQKRIPIARNYLPEATDVLGQPRQDFGPIQGPLDPTRATADLARSNPVLRELVRLDLGLSGVKRKDDESAADHRERVQTFGQMLTSYGAALLSNPQYQSASDTDKRKVLGALSRQLKQLLGDYDEAQAGSKLSSPALFNSVERSARQKERNQREREQKRERR